MSTMNHQRWTIEVNLSVTFVNLMEMGDVDNAKEILACDT